VFAGLTPDDGSQVWKMDCQKGRMSFTASRVKTAYLAAGAPHANVWTIEGANAVAAVAGRNFHSLDLKNVDQVTGDFDQVLDMVLDKAGPVDLAFLDGNHRLEP